MSGLLRDSAGYLAIRAVNGIIAIATLTAFTHVLNSAQYGKYALIVATIGFSSTLGFQWLAVSLGRFLVGERENPAALLQAADSLFLVVSTVGIVVAALVSIVCHFQGREIIGVAVLVLIGAIGMGRHSLNVQIANTQRRPTMYGLLSAIRGVTTLIAGVTLVIAGFGYLGAVAGLVLGAVTTGVVARVLLRPKNARYAVSLQQETRTELLRYGIPLSLTYLSVTVIDLSDRFLISWFLGASAVAGYAASYDLVQQVVGALLNVAFLAGFPRATAAWEAGDRRLATETLRGMARFILFFGGLTSVMFVGLAPSICRVVFGVGMRASAARVMPIIACALLLAGYRSYFLDAILQLARNVRGQVKIMFVVASTNVLFNLVMIPRFGTVGAAWGALVAVLIGVLLTTLIGRRTLRIGGVSKDLIKTVAISGTLAYGLSFIRSPAGLIQSALVVVVAMIGFLVAALAINLCEIRPALRKWWRNAFKDWPA